MTATRWLDLLLRDVSADGLVRYGAQRARAAEQAADPEAAAAAERETAAALRLKSLLRQRSQRAAELAALNDIAGRLATLHTPDDVLPEIVHQARRLLGVDVAYLGLVEGDAMRIKVASGSLTSELEEVSLPLSAGLASSVISRAAPQWTTDYRGSADFRHYSRADAAAAAENIRGLLGVPLQVRGHVLGALFAAKRQERHFADEEVALLAGLAAHAGVAIDNARSRERLNTANAQLARRSAELERTLHWDRRLTDVVLRGGGVEDLLAEVASTATDRVVFVPTGAPLPQQWERAAEGHGDELLEPPGETASARRPVPGPESERRPSPGPESAPYVRSRRVAAGDKDFGTLVMTGTGTPSRDDELLLDRAAPALALALFGEHAAAEATRQTRNAFLIGLVTTPAHDERDRVPQMRLAGLDPSAAYTVIVVQPSGSLAEARRAMERLALPDGTILAEHGARLIAVSPTDRPDELRALWPTGPDAPTAGIAGPARGPAALSDRYREALQTLDALTALERHGDAATADQLGLYRILLHHTGRRELDAMFEHLLGPVLAEQERRGVPLLDTVRMFLAEGRRPRAAAAALGVHVNTLYQRLATVDRLLGTHWREPRQALDLQLLFRLKDGADRLIG